MSTQAITPATVVPGHDVLSLIAARGGRCTVFELRAAVARAYGADAVFGNCHGNLFDFEGLLAFLERKGKILTSGDVVALGPAPACAGH
jgi:probable metal-binding protein